MAVWVRLLTAFHLVDLSGTGQSSSEELILSGGSGLGELLPVGCEMNSKRLQDLSHY